MSGTLLGAICCILMSASAVLVDATARNTSCVADFRKAVTRCSYPLANITPHPSMAEYAALATAVAAAFVAIHLVWAIARYDDCPKYSPFLQRRTRAQGHLVMLLIHLVCTRL